MAAEVFPDADKTATPSLDLEKSDGDVQKAKVDSEARRFHPDRDFRTEERAAAVEPPQVVGDYPDGGLTAWLVVVGVCRHIGLVVSTLSLLHRAHA